MSINKGNINVTSKKVGDVFIFKAELLVRNDNTIPARTLNGVPKDQRNEFVFNVEHTLAMSIIAHIYGDLIDPINFLIQRAKVCSDYDGMLEIEERQRIISDILMGKIPEPEEKGVIIHDSN